MGKKYAIEFEEEPFGKNDNPVIPHGLEELWRVKGFNSLVFDENGIKKLTPLEDILDLAKHEVYGNGFNEGYDVGLRNLWDAVKKVYVCSSYDGGYDVYRLAQIFGKSDWNDVIKSLSPSEFLKKISDYEEMMSEIKAGDEVVHAVAGTIAICTSNLRTVDDEVYVMFDDGSCGQYPEDKLRKTGKHYSSFDEFLKRKEGCPL